MRLYWYCGTLLVVIFAFFIAQTVLLNELGCVSPFVGVLKEFIKQPRCLQYPKEFEESIKRGGVLGGKYIADRHYGTKFFPNSEQRKHEEFQAELKKKENYTTPVDKVYREFQTQQKIQHDMVANIQEILDECVLPCSRIRLDSWWNFDLFHLDFVEQTLTHRTEYQVLLQNILRLMSKSADSNIRNGISDAMLEYLAGFCS